MSDQVVNNIQVLDTRLADLSKQFPKVEIDRQRMKSHTCVMVNPADLLAVMKKISSWNEIPMNYLRCLTAVDQLTHIEVVYIFASVPVGADLAVTTRCPRENGVLPSVYDLWPTAFFHEREVYEFFGVQFEGHPDLRRLLTMDQMKGFPLLKDYPKGGDPDDLIAMDAFLPEGWLEKMAEEKKRLKTWFDEEVKKRTTQATEPPKPAKSPGEK